jgi:hypothetical protein
MPGCCRMGPIRRGGISPAAYIDEWGAGCGGGSLQGMRDRDDGGWWVTGRPPGREDDDLASALSDQLLGDSAYSIRGTALVVDASSEDERRRVVTPNVGGEASGEGDTSRWAGVEVAGASTTGGPGVRVSK